MDSTRTFHEGEVVSGADWSNIVRALEAESVTFEGVIFRGADLKGSVFRDVTFEGCDFTGADLEGVEFSDGSVLTGCDLTRAWAVDTKLRGAHLIGCTLGEATLRGADLAFATLDDTHLECVDASSANFIGSALNRCKVSGDFVGALFGDSKWSMTEARDSCFWYVDWTGASIVASDFGRADLSKGNLESTLIDRTSLLGAKMSKARVTWSRIVRSNMDGADLRGSIFVESLLEACTVREVMVQYAEFRKCQFQFVAGPADTSDAKFKGDNRSNPAGIGATFGGERNE